MVFHFLMLMICFFHSFCEPYKAWFDSSSVKNVMKKCWLITNSAWPRVWHSSQKPWENIFIWCDRIRVRLKLPLTASKGRTFAFLAASTAMTFSRKDHKLSTFKNFRNRSCTLFSVWSSNNFEHMWFLCDCWILMKGDLVISNNITLIPIRTVP